MPTRPSANPFQAGENVLTELNARDAEVLDYAEALTGEAAMASTQTTSFTLSLGMKGQSVPCSHASTGITVTIPLNSSVAFPVGSWVEVVRMGAAAVTIAAGSTTIRCAVADRTLRAQYSTAMLRKIATDEWLLVGDLG